MESNYFGEPNHPGLLSPSSSPASRKGKKGSSDKSKQPQRGLGVAQLEKIRLHGQLGSSYLPHVHNPYASNFSQEDIRPQSAYPLPSSSLSHSSASPSYGFQGHHGVMMGLPDFGKANITHGDSQARSVARWHPGNNAGFGTQHFVESSMTRSFFEPETQGLLNKKNQKDGKDLKGSSSGNSESCSSQEIDLELRLSL